ncbi:MAG: PQQ-binding-like beta-propeller repeat protein [Myxococcales bacterium]|nr:PQQ-binding-like beta-propeller repeat protein [Myxococcales bacterium]
MRRWGAVLWAVLWVVGCGDDTVTDTDAVSDTDSVSDSGTDADTDTDSVSGESAYPELNWPAIHRDAANSDVLEADGARELEPLFHVMRGSLIAAVLTMGPTGVAFATTGNPGTPCHLYALDGETGEQLWCSDLVNGRAVASSALSDRDGNVYLADDQNMHSFTVDGEVRWSTPIEGPPLSAQFTPDGHLIFITMIGRIHVLERDSGEPVLDSVETVEGASYDGSGAAACLMGGSGCFSANTLAVRDDGVFYFTLSRPGEAEGVMVAMRYRGGPSPAIEPVWETDVLEGGSAASPTISADGTRIYGTDNADNLFALDADSGALIWLYPLGYTPLGSPAVDARGRIMPGGAGSGARALALRDGGDGAELLWEREDVANAGLTVMAGEVAYVVSQGMVTLDVLTGETLDEDPAETDATIGITLASDGRVYTAGLTSGIFAFAPAGR